MDILEVSERVERIELLAKVAHADYIGIKEKTIALIWIEEIADEVIQAIRKKNPPIQGGSCGGSGF